MVNSPSTRIDPLLLIVILVAAMKCDGSRLSFYRLIESREHDSVCPGYRSPTLRRCLPIRTTASAKADREPARPLSHVHGRGALEARRSGLDQLVRWFSSRHDVDLPQARPGNRIVRQILAGESDPVYDAARAAPERPRRPRPGIHLHVDVLSLAPV